MGANVLCSVMFCGEEWRLGGCEQMDHIKASVMDRNRPQGHLSPSRDTNRRSAAAMVHYKEHNIARWMRDLVAHAGLAWHATHVLRKTCGTRIADGGGGVAAVATHLRHKSLQTASRYIDRRGASSRALDALETSWRRGSEQG